jgi:hypothetical protein
MAADLSFARHDRLRQPRRLLRRFNSILVRLRVDELERVRRHHFLIQPFVIPVVEKRCEPVACRQPEMVIAMRADLQRLDQLTLVKRALAFLTFDEDPFCLYGTLFVVRGVFNLWFISSKPGHNG